MYEKKFKKSCDKIYFFFDELDSKDFGKEFPISNGLDLYKFLNAKKFDDHTQDDITDILYHVRSAFFTLGYVIGQSFEITYPEARKDIEIIKRVIREKQLLPYFPRERKERREP